MAKESLSMPSAPAFGEERMFTGLGVSPGVAIGVVYHYDAGAVTVPEYCLPKDQILPERLRFAEALAAAVRQVETLRGKTANLPAEVSEELGYLLDAHLQMLKGSRLVRGVERRITEDRVNAEAAVQQEIGQIADSFAAMDDAYLASRVDDIREVGLRLVRNLTKTPFKPFSNMPANAVVLAEELSPADTALLNPAEVAGMATVLGGAAGHTAIMARSLGLPSVVGIAGVLAGVRTGMPVIIDGTAGAVILNPSRETLKLYRVKRADLLRERRRLDRMGKVPAVTLDGTHITLLANLELPAEIDAVMANGAAGIGLFRSEFMYMNRDDLPSEEEQYQLMAGLVRRLDGRPLTIRTLDCGGDKLAPALGIVDSPNPALGMRAIRLSLKRPDILDPQLAAILRAGVHGPVRILLPMVCAVSELVAVRHRMEQVAKDLTARKIPIASPLPPLGTMIEVPGAALAADSLAWHSDFFAIGTNDLTQYTLAIDRTDEAVAHLYDPLHPAVLRLLQFSTEAALRARIPISVCGEIAGNPRFTALLLGLGIRDLSMSAHSIPLVKERVRSLDMVAASRRTRLIMDQADSGRIGQLLDDFNATPAE
jgi:phosphotransferase system enzyme I (PtsI)